MFRDLPIAILVATIWTYWSTVLALILVRQVRHGRRAGVVPRKRREKRLWLGFVPVFLAWITLPALAAFWHSGPFGLPGWAVDVAPLDAARAVAAGMAVLCYFASLYCWLLMGRNWSIAILPGQQSELITRGIFRWVRHPIYSLSICLMLCTVVATLSWAMLIVAVVHRVLMHLKARSEEQFLAERHGESYAAYCGRVGRFFPRLSVPEKASRAA